MARLGRGYLVMCGEYELMHSPHEKMDLEKKKMSSNRNLVSFLLEDNLIAI